MHPFRHLLRKLGFADPTLRPLVEAHVQHEARITPEKLRLKYVNLGDFGGTDPIQDSWYLEIAGPTFEYRDTLKRLGLKWDPRSQTWKIDAVLYRYNNRQRSMEWDRNRKLQQAALPVLQQLAKQHNDRIDAEARAGKPETTRDLVDMWRQQARMRQRLEEAGIKVEWAHPGRYDVTEAKVFVSGNTFPLVALMKKYGFKWDPSKKAWWIVGDDYQAVSEKWMGEVIRGLPKVAPPPEVTSTPFSDMSDRELTAFLGPYLDADMEANEYYDGEVRADELMARWKLNFRRLSPADQTKQYEEMMTLGPQRWHWRG